MSEYAAMIFAQSAKEPHEPQPRTARTAAANRTNRDRTACVKLLLGSTVYYKMKLPRCKYINRFYITPKLREAFLFQVPNSFGIFLITFAILKNPFANPRKKVANLVMEFAMFLS